MHPTLTYELRASFEGDSKTAAHTKEQLIDWLLMNGVESFVEGELAVDINQDQDAPPRDYYTELGGDRTPMSVYRYSRESLDDLQVKLNKVFALRVTTAIHAMTTETWMEGWKESFLPFATEVFYVKPPWRNEPAERAGLVDLVIEPGMAFGTGQHATTQLCLEQIGADYLEFGKALGVPRRSVLDVGTGTGIWLIGAKKLGYGTCLGTDIEDDAILAAEENGRLNGVTVPFKKGSLPQDGSTYDLVLANILAVVLIRIMDDLAAATNQGGRLILSGLLTDEAPEVIARGVQSGLKFVRQGSLLDWGCVVMEKV